MSGNTADSIATSKPSTSESALKSTSPKKDQLSTGDALRICRDRYWQFLNCFQGSWLKMEIELVEKIAQLNYDCFLPHPIDPAILSDIVSIRLSLQEAGEFARLAASDATSALAISSSSRMSSSARCSSRAKMSQDRRFRLRELACKKMTHAYHLDESLCSLVNMHCSSVLSDVGDLVLRHNPGNLDAKYLKIFHEKLDSQQQVEWVDLQPLMEIVAQKPGQPETLRTMAGVKCLQQDFHGAITDLTHALTASYYQQQTLKECKDNHSFAGITPEFKLPKGFHGQLLFHRADVYLTIACQTAECTLANTRTDKQMASNVGEGSAKEETKHRQEPMATESKMKLSVAQQESFKLVKKMAKNALKDYTAFISQFHYSPNFPITNVTDFERCVDTLIAKTRQHRINASSNPTKSYAVFNLSDLFKASPPSELLQLQSQLNKKPASSCSPEVTMLEWRTFHPMLSEALHAILLCHCLLQTSKTEMRRHAYMVARLQRLSDGFPLFREKQSPAQEDWMNILQLTRNSFNLDASWEDLCNRDGPPLDSFVGGSSYTECTSSHNKSVRSSIRPFRVSPKSDNELENYSRDDGRAERIAKWVLEAPALAGSTRRKKKPKNKKASDASAGTVIDIANMSI